MALNKGKTTLDRARAAAQRAIDEAQERSAAPPQQDPDDIVDVASAASMDASDPPSFTATITATEAPEPASTADAGPMKQDAPPTRARARRTS